MLRKFKENRKGFTLIELMMVVAVIGILAVVLIPKIGGVKDTAKESGVDNNVRQIQALVESRISKYNATNSGAKSLEDDLVIKITNFNDNNKIKNPVNNSTDIVELGDANATLAQTAAVVHAENGATAGDKSASNCWPASGDTDYIGAVGIAAYIENSKLYVDIIPYDSAGVKGNVITVAQ